MNYTIELNFIYSKGSHAIKLSWLSPVTDGGGIERERGEGGQG